MADDGRSAVAGDLRWAIKNGVLDLYGEYKNEAGQAVVADIFVRSVCQALNFPQSPFMLTAVAAAVGDTALKSSDSEYSAEIADLADRLGIAQSEPRATSHEPRATSHEPRATSHETVEIITGMSG